MGNSGSCDKNCTNWASIDAWEDKQSYDLTRQAFCPFNVSTISIGDASGPGVLQNINAVDGRRQWKTESLAVVPSYYESSDACYYMGACCNKFSGAGHTYDSGPDNSWDTVCEVRNYANNGILCPTSNPNDAGPNTPCVYQTGYRGTDGNTCDCCTNRTGIQCSKVSWDGSHLQDCCLGIVNDPLTCNPLWGPDSPTCASFFEDNCNVLHSSGTQSNWTAGDVNVAASSTLSAGVVHCGAWQQLQRSSMFDDGGNIFKGWRGNPSRLMGSWAAFCTANRSLAECQGININNNGTTLPLLKVTTDIYSSQISPTFIAPFTLTNLGTTPLTVSASGVCLTDTYTISAGQTQTVSNAQCPVSTTTTTITLVDMSTNKSLTTLHVISGKMPDRAAYGFSTNSSAATKGNFLFESNFLLP